MSIRQGNNVIAGHINYHPDLFDRKWADHLLNDVSWLRADTFSWQDGGVYEAAYDHLEADITGKSLSSETVAGITVQFYLADDGHKICPDSQESNVASIYNATGVAWYYIIDTVNERFKLPRVNPSKAETLAFSSAIVDTVSTNHTASSTPLKLGTVGTSTAVNRGSGNPLATYGDNGIGTNSAGGSWGSQHEKLAPINLEADLTTGVTSYFSGTKYLYFYVGNFTQTAIENTAGLNASLFNGKADLDFNNTSMIDYVIEKQDPTALNGYTWYRKYKSGWVEQGGKVSGSNTAATINFPIAMADGNYYINGHVYGNTDQNTNWIKFGTRNTTGTTYVTGYGANNLWALTTVWEVKGYAAS